jgi:hypothetical protein
MPATASAMTSPVATAALPAGRVSVTNTLVWTAVTLGVASAIPGMVMGLYGLPIGLAAAVVSAAALVRLTNKPPAQRRGELLTLLSLGAGVFQVVFALVAFYFVNLA